MTTGSKLKVQFGSGPIAFENWLNYDCSPTMRIQRIPVIGAIARRRMTTVFDEKVLYGDTRSGLPLTDDSVFFLYCSHVLEHLWIGPAHTGMQPPITARGSINPHLCCGRECAYGLWPLLVPSYAALRRCSKPRQYLPMSAA